MTVPPIPLPGRLGRAPDRPQPAPTPARDVTGAMLGLGQVLGALTLAAGVYLLAGIAWTLVLVGGLVFVLLSLADYARSRPVPPTSTGGER